MYYSSLRETCYKVAAVNVLEVDVAQKSFRDQDNAEVVAIEGLKFEVPKGEFT